MLIKEQDREAIKDIYFADVIYFNHNTDKMSQELHNCIVCPLPYNYNNI